LYIYILDIVTSNWLLGRRKKVMTVPLTTINHSAQTLTVPNTTHATTKTLSHGVMKSAVFLPKQPCHF